MCYIGANLSFLLSGNHLHACNRFFYHTVQKLLGKTGIEFQHLLAKILHLNGSFCEYQTFPGKGISIHNWSNVANLMVFFLCVWNLGGSSNPILIQVYGLRSSRKLFPVLVVPTGLQIETWYYFLLAVHVQR